MSWPNTDDGDVFRRLLSSQFDFNADWQVDYNVDFKSWPPAKEAISRLREDFANPTIYEPEDGRAGYVLFREHGRLTYDRVIAVQEQVSKAMAPFGGVCESWGVFH